MIAYTSSSVSIPRQTSVALPPFYEGVQHGVPKLLKLFDRHDVKGTFFFTGEAAKVNPDIAKMVAQSTSEVGCHSLYHENGGRRTISTSGRETSFAK